MIAWTIYLSLIAALLVLLAPAKSARWVALLATAAGFVIALVAFCAPPSDFARMTTIINLPWVAPLGISYHLATDGLSLTMAVVTGLTACCAVLFSWQLKERPSEFFFWLLLVVAGSYGVFLSADLFLFFVFYEFVIFPKYFLILLWGSTNKEYGAMKLTLYSFLGGILVFLGIIAAYTSAGTLDLQKLSHYSFTSSLQIWAFPVLFLGFAILAGIWPLHTWAPTGHVAAPTAGSMLLAGIVMKLGAYGALRVAMNLFPLGFHFWSKWITLLAVIGIVYAAAAALRQSDLKFVIGYSSVSHMGFVLLGLAAANTLGVSGAVLQMFSHGIIGALLFALAGVIYLRTHTRNLDDLSRLGLSRTMPFLTVMFVLASAASLGIPGFSGFAAEIIILIGTWHSYPVAVWITGIGMVLVAAFTLRALRMSFFSDASLASHEFAPVTQHDPMTLPERLGSILLVLATAAVGLYPQFLLDRIMPAIETMRFLKL